MAKRRRKGTRGLASGNPFASMKSPGLRGKTGKQEALSFVTALWEYLKETKRGHEKKWREQFLFIADEHWLEWDDSTNAYQNAVVQDWVPRPQTNYIAKTFDRLVDIFTSQNLTPKGRPFSDDQDDIDSAARSTEMLGYVNSEVMLDTHENQSLAAGFLIATGNVILKALLDPKGGERSERPVMEVVDDGPIQITNPNGSVTDLTDSDGVPMRNLRKAEKRDPNTGEMVMEKVQDGAVWEKPVSPLNWYPEITDDPSNVTYGIEVEVLTVAQAIEMFGEEEMSGVVPEDISVYGFGNFLDTKLRPLFEKREIEYVLLKTFRAQPSEYFPEGRTIMVIGDRCMHNGPLEEYLEGRLPYRHIRYRVLPGEFWGLSPFQPAIPLQKRLNAIDSAIVANRKQNINPQWIEPKGADIGTVDGRMGARVIWDWRKSGGHAPTPKPSVGLDASVVQEREFVIRDLESLIGTTEILTGNQPSGVDTFGQTQILAEQALRRFNPQVQRWKRGWAAHERRKLMIIKNTYTTERLIEIIGENEESEVRTFKGSDIGNTRDVIIDMTGGIVFSDAFEKQKVFQAAGAGLLNTNDPSINNRLLEILEIPGFINQFSLDAKRARRILKGIRDGSMNVGDPQDAARDSNMVTARSNDEHQVYFTIYSDFTKTAEYDSLEPDVKQQIGFLMSQHQQAMIQAKMQAIQAVQNTRGSGPQSEGALADANAVSSGADVSQLVPSAAQ